MANGHSVIPLDDNVLAKESIAWLESEWIYIPKDLPEGRFPTLSELRQVINGSGYKLEETYDWYVTSDDDHTEIWFKGERSEDAPTEFWFRRGNMIVLDIMQKLANQCGSCIVVDHSGVGAVLIAPDSIFDVASQPLSGFVSTLVQRMPSMIDRLQQASHEETLFLTAQIQQALQRLDYIYQHEFFQSAQQGMPAYFRLLKYSDLRVRMMAFDIVTRLRDKFYESSALLGEAISSESDPDTKAKMIWALEKLIARGIAPNGVGQETQALLNMLLEISNDPRETPSVRFAAANLLVRAQPGFLTPEIHSIFIDALMQPEIYKGSWNDAHSVNHQTLETVKKLLLHHRLDILLAALPQMTFAQDAHDALHALLDYTFFGEIRFYWAGSLLDTQSAERPPIDETRFREHLSRNWLYHANPTKLTAAELMPFQREILETAMTLEIPWMVHSNLLEKYGFPATRADTRALLNTTH